MDWFTWRGIYTEILADFGYDREADEAAREVLRDLMWERLREFEPVQLRALQHARDAFRDKVRNQNVYVIGAAVTAPELDAIPQDAVVVVSDGAAHLALPRFKPAAIVTDLDGDVEAQAAANAKGVPLFVHAHGDNVPALEAWVNRFTGPVFGTTQAGPLPPTWNHGGFTDGDRACCIAEAFGAASLTLVGFDFENPVEKAGRDDDVKRRKLAWARRIIDALSIPVVYATSSSTHAK